MTNGDSILLTMTEAASALTMSKRTLERLIAAQEFPKPIALVPPRGCIRVPASDVDAYLEKLFRRRNGGRAQP